MSFLSPLARQPIEILLAIAAFLGNKEAISLFRLNTSFWRSHRSPAGRYYLQPPPFGRVDYYSIFTACHRPSHWPRKFLNSPGSGNFLISGVHLTNDEEIEIFLYSLKHHPASPFSRVFHVCWDFSGRALELPRTVHSIEFGPTFNLPVKGLPDSITSIRFGRLFNRPLEEICFPPSLTRLAFGNSFNRPLTPEFLPEGLEELDISTAIRKPDSITKLPIGLKTLKISSLSCLKENLPPGLKILHLSHIGPFLSISPSLPNSLEEIYFHRDFNESLPVGFFNQGIKWIDLGESFNFPLSPGHFPLSLKGLRFGLRYQQPILPGVLPSSLEELQFPYNQCCQNLIFTILPSLHHLKAFRLTTAYFRPTPSGEFLNNIRFYAYRLAHFFHLSSGMFSEGLESLFLGGKWNFPLSSASFPSTLKRLQFGNSFEHPIAPAILPSSLKFLRLGDSWNSPLEPGMFPPRIERIEFGRDFNQKLGQGIFPPSVTAIKLGSRFQQEILPGHLPDSLVELNLSNYYFGYFPAAALPAGLVLDSLGEKKFLNPVELKMFGNHSSDVLLVRRFEGQRFIVRKLVSLRPRSATAWNDYYLLEPCESAGDSIIVNGELIPEETQEKKKEEPSREEEEFSFYS